MRKREEIQELSRRGLKSTGALRFALAVLAGLLLSSSFAPLEWAQAAWIAPALLLAITAGASSREAFYAGWAGGAAFWLTSIWWLTHVTFVGWFFLASFCGLFVAVWSWLLNGWIRRFGIERFLPNLGLMFFAAALWAGLELARSHLWTGFPWNPLAATQYLNVPLLQSASIGGAHLVSAIVVFVSAAFGVTALRYWALRGRWGRRLHFEVIVGVVVMVVCLMAGARRAREPIASGTSLRVALIQPNIPQDEKWDQAKVDLIYRRLAELTESAIILKPDLVIWPETALPDDMRSSPASYELVYGLATSGVPILVGTMDTSWRETEPLYYNSSFLINTYGMIEQTYDKRHLVPFGEYVPMRRFLPFMKAMTPIQESFYAGSTSTVFTLKSATFSALICFEDAVAGLARESVRNGARMLVNQTNDAWFDPSSASRQHMAQSVLRAAENGVPVIRSANSGVTCVINARGRLVDSLDRMVAGFKLAEVDLPRAAMPMTLYNRLGDFPIWVAFGISVAATAATRRES